MEPPTINGRTSREVQQTLRDIEEFVGALIAKKRQLRQPDRYQALVAQVKEPSSFQEVIQHHVWVYVMVEEYSSIMTNDDWEIVPRPMKKSIVDSIWIYKIKYATDGSVEKYKATFVTKGYARKEGRDYEETFVHVAQYTSIRSIISLVAQMGCEIHQMDVKEMFLNGAIEEDVYIEQLEGFETHDKITNVCRLKKALYGLKQAPNLYQLLVEDELLILVLYVDDLFLMGSSRLIENCKKNLENEFDMKDLGLIHYFMGLDV